MNGNEIIKRLKAEGWSVKRVCGSQHMLEAIVSCRFLFMVPLTSGKAPQRIAIRDADDWSVLACAMAIGCRVWTEDVDFFGTGVATWTTDRIALYLV